MLHTWQKQQQDSHLGAMHVQVTGDDHVPAGKHTWHAAAAPLKRPWATAEAALVDMQGQLLLQQAAGDLEEAMESHKNVSTQYRPISFETARA